MKHTLLAAKHEIEALRRRNEILQAKVEVMDLFACVLHTVPASYNPPMGVDVARELDNEISRLEKEECSRAMSENNSQPKEASQEHIEGSLH